MKKNYYIYVFFLVFQAILAQQPQYDPNFGNNGFLEFDNGVEHIFKLKTLPDGRFYIIANFFPDRDSGDYTRYAYISRHLPDGSYDPNFGIDGMSVLYNYPQSGYLDFELLPDQSIICTFVQSVNYQSVWSVVKLTPDGQLDTNFGNNGLAPYGNHSITVQSDGKIIISGINEQSHNAFAGRLLPDGTLDTSFGTQGVTEFITPDTDPWNRQISILPDNHIIYLIANLGEAYLAKTDANGHLVDNFGNNGVLPIDTPPDNSEYITQFLVTPQQNIILTGHRTDLSGGMSDCCESVLMQYDSSGNVDTNFGNNGYVITDLTSGNSTGWSAILQPDGKIVQYITSGYPMSASNGDDRIAGLARFTPDGQLDTGFATDGYLMNYYYGHSNRFIFYDMKWHQGNNLLMAGVKGAGIHNGYIARVLNVYDPSEMEAETEHPTLSIYPNPVGQYLHIKSETAVKSVEIYSMKGQLILSGKDDIIDVSDIAAGVYLAHIQTGKEVIVKKFVKM